MNKIKVLLVDDHKMFLEGLTSILLDDADIQVMDTVVDGHQAMEYMRSNEVDVVVTDINMPEMDGIELNLKLKKKWPNVKALVLSSHSDAETIKKVISANVDGYLLKNAEKEELILAIKEIYKGNTHFSAEVQEAVVASMFSSKKNDTPPVLSKREQEVLTLIADEYTAVEIADQLFISQHTVNSHKKNLLSKLGVKNTAGLIKYALLNGLIK